MVSIIAIITEWLLCTSIITICYVPVAFVIAVTLAIAATLVVITTLAAIVTMYLAALVLVAANSAMRVQRILLHRTGFAHCTLPCSRIAHGGGPVCSIVC